MAATAYLLQIPSADSQPCRVLRDGVSAVAINANSVADARAFMKAQYGDDIPAMWDLATATAIAADADWTGWSFRVKVVDPDGDTVADVTVAPGDGLASLVKAAQTLTGDGTNITNGDTVTIGSKVYTFEDTLTNVDGHVLKAGSAAGSLTNLFHAINASGGVSGTDYAALTTANTQVVATNPSGTTVVVTAITAGSAGNAIATTEVSTHLSWGAATLAGGVGTASGLSSLALGMVAALNATTPISGAAWNDSTHVLKVAETTDGLGDHRVFAYFIPSGADTTELKTIDGLVASKVDAGAAGDALTLTLRADTHTVPTIVALLGEKTV